MSERIEALARRVATDPAFLAAALAVYARAEKLGDAELALRLGCRPSQLAGIRLCRMPRAATPQFQQDIDRIAARFLIDGGVIAEAVRMAAALTAFGQMGEEGGYLMVARDRENEAGNAVDEDEPR